MDPRTYQYRVRGGAGPLRLQAAFGLREHGAGTALELRMVARVRGLPPPLDWPLALGLRHHLQRALAALRQRVEAAEPSAQGPR